MLVHMLAAEKRALNNTEDLCPSPLPSANGEVTYLMTTLFVIRFTEVVNRAVPWVP